MTRRAVIPAVLAAFAILGAGCATGGQTVHEAYASHQSQVASAAPAAPSTPAVPERVTTVAAAVTAGSAQSWGRVARVIDGDTFVVGDDTIRVLGIDACETDTAGGGEATQAAQSLLLGPDKFVVVTAEPGVDRDQYGRLLRYVRVGSTNDSPSDDGYDFGTEMVGYYHTGVYQGRNDASANYLAALRDADQYTGRDCSSDPGPDATSTPQPDSGDVYVHLEDDGESRFCGRRWWC